MITARKRSHHNDNNHHHLTAVTRHANLVKCCLHRWLIVLRVFYHWLRQSGQKNDMQGKKAGPCFSFFHKEQHNRGQHTVDHDKKPITAHKQLQDKQPGPCFSFFHKELQSRFPPSEFSLTIERIWALSASELSPNCPSELFQSTTTKTPALHAHEEASIAAGFDY